MIRPRIRRLFRLGLRRRTTWERDVEDEIMLHLSLRAEQLAAHGLPAHAARDEAIRRFGPLNESRAQLLAAAREREERMRHTEFVADLRQDVTFAFRRLRREKGWTTVAITTLALGIAATTAVWSAASTLLLHPLPYPNARRIVIVNLQPTQKVHTAVEVIVSPPVPVVRAWREHSTAFEALEPVGNSSALLRSAGEATELSTAKVLPSFLSFAGQKPLLGHNFTRDEIDTKSPVVLLGEGFWRSRYGASPTIVGSTIVLDDSPYRVIGVMPSTLQIPRVGDAAPDVWLPLDMSEPNQRTGVRVFGRLKPGVATDVARKELDTLAARSGVYAPGTMAFVAVLMPPGRTVSFRDSLLLLSGAVALVLLVACANVAHLMVARAVVRQRELAIRSALGAGRSRLLRQLLTESVILTCLGATLGIALGFAGLKALIALRPSSLSQLQAAHADWLTFGVIVAISVVSAVFFGLVAALYPHSGSGMGETLKAGSVSSSPARQGDRLRSLLVVSEMAMSAMLLIGATLLIRTVVNMQNFDLGFDPKNLYAVQIDLPNGHYPSAAAKDAAIARVQARLARVPGIQSTAVSSVMLSGWSASIGALEVEGEPTASSSATSFIPVNKVSIGFFRTIGARIVDGRGITDTSSTSKEVVVNAGFARRHWSGRSAVGHRIRISFQGHGEDWMTIVGVVGDIMTGGPTSENSAPVLYVTRTESERPALFVRTDGNASTPAGILAAARSLHPQLPPRLQTAQSIVKDAIAAPKFIMMLLTLFTVLALVLACIGLYGVMAYSVAQRTREIGIRMALGASGSSIARTIITRGAALGGAGAIVGLVLAYWGTRIIQGSLFGISRLDAPSFVVGALLLMVSAVAACVAPTRRAVAVDPITAIRAD
jgi:predicted permease